MKDWPTPRRLRAYLVAVVALALLQLLLAEDSIGLGRRTVQTIGRDAAPSVVLAQQLSASLVDFDANVGNTLLGDERHRRAAEEVLRKRRVEVTDRIVDAAENITFGDAEKVPIRNLMGGWTTYLDLVSETTLLDQQRDHARALAKYFEASRYLHDSLLSEARSLDKANRSALDDAYAHQQRTSGFADAVPVVLGLALLAVLLGAQVFCYRRTHRIINPGLAAAFVAIFASTIYLTAEFRGIRHTIQSAKEDAFESIHALWKARAIAYDANAEETRWLLDNGGLVDRFERAFDEDVAALTSSPLRRTDKTSSGLFADELRNVTFEGEQEAAQAMIKAYGAYYEVDRRIRELEHQGRHDAAVDLCLGESNDLFERFDRDLQAVVDINQREFEQSIAAADEACARGRALAAVLAIGAAVLAFFGIRARLREYGA